MLMQSVIGSHVIVFPNVFKQSVIMLNVEASFEMNEVIPEEIIVFFCLSGFWTETQNKESQI